MVDGTDTIGREAMVAGITALVEAALSVRGFFHLVDIGVPFPIMGREST